MTLTRSHKTCVVQTNYLYTALTPTPTPTQSHTQTHMYTHAHTHAHTHTHTSTHTHTGTQYTCTLTHTHRGGSDDMFDWGPLSYTRRGCVRQLLLFLLLHNGRCRVCLCKTMHAECHLCRDSCYKCMVQ